MSSFIKNQKFKVGVSVNHKSTQNHSMIRFTEKELTLEEIVKLIKENCFLYPLVEENVFERGLHSVVGAVDFKSTCLIPFDLDYEEGRGISFEDCLQLLGEKYRPTIAFKTRSYDSGKHIYHYRLMYLFESQVVGRQDYYTLVASVKNKVLERLGDIGDDGDSYGFNTKHKGWKGNCCKPIRTNSKEDIVVTNRLYQTSDFEIDDTFIRHPELLCPKKNSKEQTENFVSEELTKFIKERNTQGIESFPLHRDFSYTHSQFHNGFAIVRGNSDYAEFPRKFTYHKSSHKYEVGRWVDGDKRRKKLRLVALISRFNDFLDNGTETITGDEVLLSVYFEAKRYYKLYDDFGGILPVDLLRIVNEVMSLDITDVLEIVRQQTSSADRGKRDHIGIFRRRNLIRVDKSFWSRGSDVNDKRLKKIKLELCFATRFVHLLQHYDESLSRRKNTEYLNTLKETDPTVPGCSLSQLSLFRGHCSSYLEEDEKSIALEDLLFLESGLSIKDIPSKYTLIKTMLEDKPELRIKLESIANQQPKISKWGRNGDLIAPDIGRPVGEWQSALTDEDANLKVSSLVRLLESKGFNPPKSSIKTWKYRMLKRIKE